jgi:hypothetical protein
MQGFDANTAGVVGNSVTGTATADSTIPTVAGESRATLVFSRIPGELVDRRPGIRHQFNGE